jgi:protein TonB
MSNNLQTPPEQLGNEPAGPEHTGPEHTGQEPELQLHPGAAPAPSSAPDNTLFGSLQKMDVKADPKSAIISGVINVTIVALLLWIAAIKTNIIPPPKVAEAVIIEAPPPPIKAPPKAQTMGGGGGQKSPTPVSKGNPPKFAPEQLNPPKAPPLEQPKIKVPVTIDVDPNLKMAKVDMPNMGMPNSPLIGNSLGNGKGTGIGSGTGAGLGAGSGGGTGGGVRRIGGGVSPPQVLFAPEPEFSEEARKAKVAGNVLVYLQVDTNGRPMNVRVLRGIGMGLDQKALEAVRQYKFKPAMENGHPVIVEMNVEVNFQIF